VYLDNVQVVGQTQSNPAITDHRAGPGDNVHSNYNSYGLAVGSGGRVMIKNSVFTGNATTGIETDGGAVVSISSSEISFNSTGIKSGGTVALRDSSINSNSVAIQGPTQSLGNDFIFGNSADGTAPTIVSGR
jgi:parallel beta helix pectate lyase-like protein